MRVLLIEDDAATAHVVGLMLRSEGVNVQASDTGEEGLDLAKHYDFDVIMLDLGLPDMSGFDVLRQMRAAGVKTPVIIVTGSTAIETEVKALDLGADDFLGKPFHKDVLVQRMRAVVRRARGHAERVIRVGPIAVDTGTKLMSVDGQVIHLTPKEYQMLELLSLRKGTTLTKEMFLNHLYGGMDEPELKIIDVFICKLRRKLGDASRFIETVWGRGYRLVDEPGVRIPLPISADPPELSMRGQVLARIAAGDTSFLQLRALNPHWSLNSLRGAVSSLIAAGRVENVGDLKSALYRLRQPRSIAA